MTPDFGLGDASHARCRCCRPSRALPLLPPLTRSAVATAPHALCRCYRPSPRPSPREVAGRGRKLIYRGLGVMVRDELPFVWRLFPDREEAVDGVGSGTG